MPKIRCADLGEPLRIIEVRPDSIPIPLVVPAAFPAEAPFDPERDPEPVEVPA